MTQDADSSKNFGHNRFWKLLVNSYECLDLTRVSASVSLKETATLESYSIDMHINKDQHNHQHKWFKFVFWSSL